MNRFEDAFLKGLQGLEKEAEAKTLLTGKKSPLARIIGLKKAPLGLLGALKSVIKRKV